ncbi:Replication protein A 70 kDa DNA-binding subunit [Lamellibrachia satsuma]|nr:Replication protein A 70 kDa DNA-binding subunit [Lamellibrachia satsuma]
MKRYSAETSVEAIFLLQEIMSGGTPDKPIVQILGQKMIAATNGPGVDRYRVLLSDGKYSHSSALLATQLNGKVTSGELEAFTVVRLNKFMCNTLPAGKRVLILLDLDVLAAGNEVANRIGNPQPFKAPDQSGQPPQNQQMEPPSNETVTRHPLNGNRTGAPSPKTNSFYGAQQAVKKPYSVQNVPKPNERTPLKVHSIDSLTPYQNRWTIRARVTSKSNIRTWSNSRGEGKLFSMNFLDESGEIRATAFKNEVDKFYDFIQLNKVYYISKAQLKTADKRYSSLNNDYEMTFNSDTQVIPCEEEVDLPTVKYNFVPISKLSETEANSTVDVIGVVRSVGDITKVTARQSQKELTKREIFLVDEGQVQVRLTLWSSDAENFDGNGYPVLAIKGCRLSDWGGRSLSSLSQSQILLNPDVTEAHKLRGWYDEVGHTMDYSEFQGDGSSGTGGGFATNWKTFADVKKENLGQDKPDYFTTKATIVFLKKENCMYMACPGEGCNKKVVDLANGLFRCEKCNKEYPSYKWRMILSANLADFSENQWVTFFQETAECILGRSADEIGQMRETDEAQFEQVFQEASFKSYIFKLRAKMETYNDESRLKTVCVQASPVNFQDYSKKLIEDIEKILMPGSS